MLIEIGCILDKFIRIGSEQMKNSLIIIISLLWAATASASPILNSNNNHYYEAIPGEYDWEDARDLAAASTHNGMSGHLATITSLSENQWIWTNLNMPFRYFLGASDYDTEDLWVWVTGETWSFARWATGEPNNSGGEAGGLDLVGVVFG